MRWGNIIIQREYKTEDQTFFFFLGNQSDRWPQMIYVCSAAFLNLTSVDVILQFSPHKLSFTIWCWLSRKSRAHETKRPWCSCCAGWSEGRAVYGRQKVQSLSSLWHPWQCQAVPWRAYGAGFSCQNKIRCFHPRVCLLMVVYYHPLLNLFVFCPTRKILKAGN